MLTGQQIAQLRNALLDAYPTHAALREIVREELSENLDAIAGGETLRAVTFSLITWAESTGRTLELIEGAYRHNDANPALREVAAALGVAVAIPTQPPAPNTRPAGGGQPSPSELRRRELQKQYDMLARQYEAASQQLQTTINAADRPLLEEQVASLAARMEAVWAQLSVLDAPTPPAPVTPPAPETIEIAVHLRMEQVTLTLDHMNQKVAPNSSRVASTLTFDDTLLGDDRRFTTLLVRFPTSEILPKPDFFEEAHRLLTL